MSRGNNRNYYSSVEGAVQMFNMGTDGEENKPDWIKEIKKVSLMSKGVNGIGKELNR